MLLYIYGKGKVGKKKVVHGIELECVFLSQNSDLVITNPMGAVADNINGNTIYTSLSIDVKNRHEKSNLIPNLWTA